MPGSQRRSASRRRPARRRWLRWALAGLALAALLWGFAVVFAPRGDAPLDDIDADSRRQLDAVLRDAERSEPAP